jgi:hypothetical protein
LLKVPNVHAIHFGAPTGRQDRAKVLHFANIRAYAYWSLREALDPEKGDNLALPPDPELLGDLCAPRWENTVSGVRLEPKEDIKERLGRSPDRGEAVVLANLILQVATRAPEAIGGGVHLPGGMPTGRGGVQLPGAGSAVPGMPGGRPPWAQGPQRRVF